METYNVYQLEIDTFKAIRLLGSNMSTGRAYVCEKNADKHINPLKHFIMKVEAGSERDLELKNNLK